MEFSKFLKICLISSFLLFKNVLYNLCLWTMTIFFNNNLSFDSIEKINLISYFLMAGYSLCFLDSKKRIKTHFKEYESMPLKNVDFFLKIIFFKKICFQERIYCFYINSKNH